MISVTEDKASKRLKQLREADKKRSAAVKRIRGDVLHEFGPRPEIESAERRQRAMESLRFFGVESGYFPLTLGGNELCQEQFDMLERLEDGLVNGGYIAHACFRGFVKTTALRIAVIWAWFSGNRRYIPWIGQTLKAAKKELAAIKTELIGNERLAADFPDFCYLFQCIGANDRLALNLKYDGHPVYMTSTKQDLVIPVLGEEGVERWCAITTRGITAEDIARGLSWTAPTGENMRPDGCVLDDIQSRKSAKSGSQTDERLETVTEDIAQSGSVDTPFCILVGGTVIQNDDFMDQVVDPDKYHSWSGVRVPKLKSFPIDWTEKKGQWEQYKKIRQDFRKEVPGDRQRAIRKSNQFYLDNQPSMDEGGEATWEYAFKKGAEYSSIQSCMNTIFDDGEKAFACECQQRPLRIEATGGELIRIPVDWWQSRMQLERKLVPRDTQAVTIGVDVQQDVLFWLAAAWSSGLSGHICDYGVYPEQPGTTVNLRKLSKTLRDVHGGTIQAALTAGLKALLIPLLQRRWMAVGGAVLPTARLLVDDGHEKDIVDTFVETSGRNQIMLPAKGTNITTKRAPMSEWTLKPGDKMGKGYVINRPGNRTRIVQHDGNIHNTLIESHLRLQTGDVGAITVFEGYHPMLGQHFHAEQGTLRSANGRSLYEWEQLDTRNDLLDSFRMSLVGAMMEGISEAGDEAQAQKNAEIEQFRLNMQSMGLKVTRF